MSATVCVFVLFTNYRKKHVRSPSYSSKSFRSSSSPFFDPAEAGLTVHCFDGMEDFQVRVRVRVRVRARVSDGTEDFP